MAATAAVKMAPTASFSALSAIEMSTTRWYSGLKITCLSVGMSAAGSVELMMAASSAAVLPSMPSHRKNTNMKKNVTR